MKKTLKQVSGLFVHSTWYLFFLEIIYKGFGALVVFPLCEMLLHLALRFSGVHYISRQNLKAAMTNPLILSVFVVILLIFILFQGFELSCLADILQTKNHFVSVAQGGLTENLWFSSSSQLAAAADPSDSHTFSDLFYSEFVQQLYFAVYDAVQIVLFVLCYDLCCHRISGCTVLLFHFRHAYTSYPFCRREGWLFFHPLCFPNIQSPLFSDSCWSPSVGPSGRHHFTLA